MTTVAPRAQWIAMGQRLNFNHVGPVVSQLQSQHIPGHHTGEIDNSHSVQHTLKIRIERFPLHLGFLV
jgi:hypothetical protein